MCELSGSKVSGNTANFAYESISNSTSDVNGKIQFTIKNEAYQNLKLDYKLLKYYKRSKLLNADSIVNNDNYFKMIYMYPASFVKLNVINQSPNYSDDHFIFRLNNQSFLPALGYSTNFQAIDGAEVDTIINYNWIGNTYFKVEWCYQRGQINRTGFDSLFVNIGDTASFQLIY